MALLFLAVLAIIAAVNALIYTLQMLHLFPTYLGPIAFYQFSLLGAIFWGLLFFIWLGVFRMLWEIHSMGWLFVMFVAGFDLIYGILCVLGASSSQAMAPTIIVSGLILIYCMLPGTKDAFGVPQ